MTYRFSVVIPCFNEEAYIAEAIRSLQRQEFDGAYEIVVVDNNCTDQTAEIARGLGARVVTEAAPGVCNARQAGTRASSGEIVISADADTTYPPDWLAKIDRGFRSGDDVVAVVGPCRYVDGPAWGPVFARALFGGVGLVYRATGRTLYVSATNIAFRRDQWEGYDVRLTQGGDELDLLRKLRARGRVVYDGGNPTLTSGRRFSRGFFYNVFVSLFLFYFAAYALNRMFGRRVIGSAPAYRDSTVRRPSHRLRLAAAGLVAGVSLLAFQQPWAYLAGKADTAVSYMHLRSFSGDVRW
ncbi:glycosyltransferase family 2 protein [Paractinoplanes globisporus]|uniref:4,4'-diaponeurosporenoate glycosyltransferase n=1 Tax=Paractinoplanes globisporus TaxID=113565 RepID=A0ABW6W9H4_9ACTN|nr:glycosyltransferase family A protein [Actinoplanes globisporus]